MLSVLRSDMQIEAVILTGGASRRMGMDKASILIEGEPMAARIARLLTAEGIPVTICGREPIAGYSFLPDSETFAGPLSALARFEPTVELVLVASCDLIGFDPAIVSILASRIADHDAAVPTLEGRLQPLCALYRPTAFAHAGELVRLGEKRVMRWLDLLDVLSIDDIDPTWLRNANTPQDLIQAGGE